MFKQEGDEAAVLTALSPTLLKVLVLKGLQKPYSQLSGRSKGGRCSLSRTFVIMICDDIEKATERVQPLSGYVNDRRSSSSFFDELLSWQ